MNAAGEIVAWQHDPEPLGNGYYTLFDNESAGAANSGVGAVSELPYSRVVLVHLDGGRARPRWSQRSAAGGPRRRRRGTHSRTGRRTFVGWGSLPYLSEFDGRGAVVFSAEFPAGVNTYRAYLLPWGWSTHPQPTQEKPMTATDEVLENNKSYVASFDKADLPLPPGQEARRSRLHGRPAQPLRCSGSPRATRT